MLIILLAYLGGVLTILSPCILPVLPFVFARSDRGFVRGALPLLAGMALTFAAVASLAAVGGGAAIRANEIGRLVALGLLGLFGLALLLPGLSERMTRPLVALGNRLSNKSGQPGQESIASSLVLGAATGLLWAPCAGPILGIIFTAAAIQGAGIDTSLLLLAYALGAATSLAAALLIGGKLFARMKRGLGATERVRQLLGVLVLAGVIAIGLGLDTRVLARLSSSQTTALETGLARTLGVKDIADQTSKGLSDEGPLPTIDRLGPWLNSQRLTDADLKGKVVLIDFWTYSCINCLRSLPYVQGWHERYARDGLVVIGVHAPEFAFERKPENVAKAVRDLKLTYPVALDNKLDLWTALKNNYWPAHYFVDAKGRVRYHHFGEGNYAASENVIRQLLAEAGRPPSMERAGAEAKGAQAAAARATIRSPETYLGFGRADRFVSPGGLKRDAEAEYEGQPVRLNDWTLGGRWQVGRQSARSIAVGATIRYRFSARDLHLVLGSPGGKPVRFRVTVDGSAPGDDAGVDIAADGSGTISGERLYQLVRQKGEVRERSFTITFLDSGAEAFAFTFG